VPTGYRILPGPVDAHLYGLRDTVCCAGVDLLACLPDLLQYRRIVHAWFGNDVRSLLVEGDVVVLDSWETLVSFRYSRRQGEYDFESHRRYVPSSFLSTRSTAPEQPPQVMVMLKS